MNVSNCKQGGDKHIFVCTTFFIDTDILMHLFLALKRNYVEFNSQKTVTLKLHICRHQTNVLFIRTNTPFVTFCTLQNSTCAKLPAAVLARLTSPIINEHSLQAYVFSSVAFYLVLRYLNGLMDPFINPD